MDIRTFKLKSGEEIIVELVEQTPVITDQYTGECWVIKNPTVLMQIPGKQDLQFVGWNQISMGSTETTDEVKDRTFYIPIDFVGVGPAWPSKKVTEAYEEIFSPIAVPTQQIITDV